MFSPSTNLKCGFVLKIAKLKEDGSNFIVWYRSLRMLLETNVKLHVMRKPLGEIPGDHSSEEDDIDYQVRTDDSTIVQCAMLAAMETRLREHFGFVDAYEMIERLKEIFATSQVHEVSILGPFHLE